MVRHIVRVAIVAMAVQAVAGCGSSKKVVTKDQFKTVSDTIYKTMNGNAHPPDERKGYTIAQLGAPHRVEGDKQSWYTNPSDCYYYEMKADGWGSSGTGKKEDCEKYAVK